MPSQLHKIVIVGGGAGGLELATQLGNQLGQSGKAEIMLIDQSLTHLWKPLWHEVAAGTLDSNADELNYVVHAHRHYFKFLLGRMSGLNRQQKCIHLSAVVDKDGLELIPSRQIPYDTLIIAVGSVSNDFNTPGAVKHCFYMDSYEQLYDFRKHFLRYFMLMEHGKTSEQQMTIAIIGAGATGVELAAELRAAAQQAVQYGWSHINPQDRVKITLVEASATILAGLPIPLIHSVAAELSRRQITVITGQRVKEVTAAGLMTDSGTFIPAALKVWAAGIKAPAFLKDLDGLETNRLNQLVVKSTLQTTLDDSIFAIIAYNATFLNVAQVFSFLLGKKFIISLLIQYLAPEGILLPLSPKTHIID